jgi:hypothetical protein
MPCRAFRPYNTSLAMEPQGGFLLNTKTRWERIGPKMKGGKSLYYSTVPLEIQEGPEWSLYQSSTSNYHGESEHTPCLRSHA